MVTNMQLFWVTVIVIYIFAAKRQKALSISALIKPQPASEPATQSTQRSSDTNLTQTLHGPTNTLMSIHKTFSPDKSLPGWLQVLNISCLLRLSLNFFLLSACVWKDSWCQGSIQSFQKGHYHSDFCWQNSFILFQKFNERRQLCEMEKQEQYCLNKLEFALWLPCSFCHTLLEMLPVVQVLSGVTSSLEAISTIIISIRIFRGHSKNIQ